LAISIEVTENEGDNLTIAALLLKNGARYDVS